MQKFLRRAPKFVAFAVALLTSLVSPPAMRQAWAHGDPAGCSGTGVSLSLSVFRADGVTPVSLSDQVTECETLVFQATISWPDVASCAFQGGTATLTTPDGVAHNVTPSHCSIAQQQTCTTNADCPGSETCIAGVPCLGGTVSPCVNGVTTITTRRATYTVNPADVSGGIISTAVSYTAAFSHTGVSHSLNVPSGSTAIPNIVQFCSDNDVCNGVETCNRRVEEKATRRSARPTPPSSNRTCGTTASYVARHIRCVMWRRSLCGEAGKSRDLTGGES
jgi:hypothetical protein